ncbi:MAG: hypothetical protein KF901_22710 [Myxococcales bacterium]|nr:hypothetical protein [Myxococcales bacterium]
MSEFFGGARESANAGTLRVERLRPERHYTGRPIAFLSAQFHGSDPYWNDRYKDVQLYHLFDAVGLADVFPEAAHVPSEGRALIRLWTAYTPLSAGAPRDLTGTQLRRELARMAIASYVAGNVDGPASNGNNGGFARFRDQRGNTYWRGVLIDAGAAWHDPGSRHEPWNTNLLGTGPITKADIPSDVAVGLWRINQASRFDLATWSRFERVDESATNIVEAQRNRARRVLDHYRFGCGALTACLAGYGGAACFTEQHADVLTCGRNGGGLACFEHHCGDIPAVCPEVVECWRGGGGAACFRPDRCGTGTLRGNPCEGAVGSQCTPLQADRRTPNACGPNWTGPAFESVIGNPYCVSDPEFRNLPGTHQFQGVSVGSMLHDQCCTENPGGVGCNGRPFPLPEGVCRGEFTRAINDARTDLRWWRHRFDTSVRPETVFDRAGQLTAYGRSLRAPYGVAVNRDEARFCASGATLLRGSGAAPFSICAPEPAPVAAASIECSELTTVDWRREGFFLTAQANYVSNAMMGPTYSSVVGHVRAVAPPRGIDDFVYVTDYVNGAVRSRDFLRTFVVREQNQIVGVAAVRSSSPPEVWLFTTAANRYAPALVDCVAQQVERGVLASGLRFAPAAGVQAFWRAQLGRVARDSRQLTMSESGSQFVLTRSGGNSGGGGSSGGGGGGGSFGGGSCGSLIPCLESYWGAAWFTSSHDDIVTCGRSQGGMACFDRCGATPNVCAGVQTCWRSGGGAACFRRDRC